MKNWSLARCIAAVALATGALLLIPLSASKFSGEMAWGWGDFVAAGVLVFSAGTAAVLAVRFLKQPLHRKFAVLTIVLAAALVWAELAVGLFH